MVPMVATSPGATRESRHVAVHGLPANYSEDKLQIFFSSYGRVQKIERGNNDEPFVVSFMDVRSAQKAHSGEHRIDNFSFRTTFHQPDAKNGVLSSGSTASPRLTDVPNRRRESLSPKSRDASSRFSQSSKRTSRDIVPHKSRDQSGSQEPGTSSSSVGSSSQAAAVAAASTSSAPPTSSLAVPSIMSIVVERLPIRSDSTIKEQVASHCRRFGTNLKEVQVSPGDNDTRKAIVWFDSIDVDKVNSEKHLVILNARVRLRIGNSMPKNLMTSQDTSEPTTTTTTSTTATTVDATPSTSDTTKMATVFDFKSSRTLYVGGLERHVSEESLRRRFGRFGHILDVDVKNMSSPTPYAFLQYADMNSAVKAINANAEDVVVKGRKFQPYFGRSMSSNKLWIGEIPSGLTDDQVEQKLKHLSDAVDVIYDRREAQAIVVFSSNESANRAYHFVRADNHKNFVFKSGAVDYRLAADFCSELLHSYFIERKQQSASSSGASAAEDTSATKADGSGVLPAPPDPPNLFNTHPASPQQQHSPMPSDSRYRRHRHSRRDDSPDASDSRKRSSERPRRYQSTNRLPSRYDNDRNDRRSRRRRSRRSSSSESTGTRSSSSSSASASDGNRSVSPQKSTRDRSHSPPSHRDRDRDRDRRRREEDRRRSTASRDRDARNSTSSAFRDNTVSSFRDSSSNRPNGFGRHRDDHENHSRGHHSGPSTSSSSDRRHDVEHRDRHDSDHRDRHDSGHRDRHDSDSRDRREADSRRDQENRREHETRENREHRDRRDIEKTSETRNNTRDTEHNKEREKGGSNGNASPPPPPPPPPPEDVPAQPEPVLDPPPPPPAISIKIQKRSLQRDPPPAPPPEPPQKPPPPVDLGPSKEEIERQNKENALKEKEREKEKRLREMHLQHQHQQVVSQPQQQPSHHAPNPQSHTSHNQLNNHSTHPQNHHPTHHQPIHHPQQTSSSHSSSSSHHSSHTPHGPQSLLSPTATRPALPPLKVSPHPQQHPHHRLSLDTESHHQRPVPPQMHSRTQSMSGVSPRGSQNHHFPVTKRPSLEGNHEVRPFNNLPAHLPRFSGCSREICDPRENYRLNYLPRHLPAPCRMILLNELRTGVSLNGDISGNVMHGHNRKRSSDSKSHSAARKISYSIYEEEGIIEPSIASSDEHDNNDEPAVAMKPSSLDALLDDTSKEGQSNVNKENIRKRIDGLTDRLRDFNDAREKMNMIRAEDAKEATNNDDMVISSNSTPKTPATSIPMTIQTLTNLFSGRVDGSKLEALATAVCEKRSTVKADDLDYDARLRKLDDSKRTASTSNTTVPLETFPPLNFNHDRQPYPPLVSSSSRTQSFTSGTSNSAIPASDFASIIARTATTNVAQTPLPRDRDGHGQRPPLSITIPAANSQHNTTNTPVTAKPQQSSPVIGSTRHGSISSRPQPIPSSASLDRRHSSAKVDTPATAPAGFAHNSTPFAPPPKQASTDHAQASPLIVAPPPPPPLAPNSTSSQRRDSSASSLRSPPVARNEPPKTPHHQAKPSAPTTPHTAARPSEATPRSHLPQKTPMRPAEKQPTGRHDSMSSLKSSPSQNVVRPSEHKKNLSNNKESGNELTPVFKGTPAHSGQLPRLDIKKLPRIEKKAPVTPVTTPVTPSTSASSILEKAKKKEKIKLQEKEREKQKEQRDKDSKEQDKKKFKEGGPSETKEERAKRKEIERIKREKEERKEREKTKGKDKDRKKMGKSESKDREKDKKNKKNKKKHGSDSDDSSASDDDYHAAPKAPDVFIGSSMYDRLKRRSKPPTKEEEQEARQASLQKIRDKNRELAGQRGEAAGSLKRVHLESSSEDDDFKMPDKKRKPVMSDARDDSDEEKSTDDEKEEGMITDDDDDDAPGTSKDKVKKQHSKKKDSSSSDSDDSSDNRRTSGKRKKLSKDHDSQSLINMDDVFGAVTSDEDEREVKQPVRVEKVAKERKKKRKKKESSDEGEREREKPQAKKIKRQSNVDSDSEDGNLLKSKLFGRAPSKKKKQKREKKAESSDEEESRSSKQRRHEDEKIRMKKKKEKDKRRDESPKRRRDDSDSDEQRENRRHKSKEEKERRPEKKDDRKERKQNDVIEEMVVQMDVNDVHSDDLRPSKAPEQQQQHKKYQPLPPLQTTMPQTTTANAPQMTSPKMLLTSPKPKSCLEMTYRASLEGRDIDEAHHSDEGAHRLMSPRQRYRAESTSTTSSMAAPSTPTTATTPSQPSVPVAPRLLSPGANSTNKGGSHSFDENVNSNAPSATRGRPVITKGALKAFDLSQMSQTQKPVACDDGTSDSDESSQTSRASPVRENVSDSEKDTEPATTADEEEPDAHRKTSTVASDAEGRLRTISISSEASTVRSKHLQEDVADPVVAKSVAGDSDRGDLEEVEEGEIPDKEPESDEKMLAEDEAEAVKADENVRREEVEKPIEEPKQPEAVPVVEVEEVVPMTTNISEEEELANAISLITDQETADAVQSIFDEEDLEPTYQSHDFIVNSKPTPKPFAVSTPEPAPVSESPDDDAHFDDPRSFAEITDEQILEESMYEEPMMDMTQDDADGTIRITPPSKEPIIKPPEVPTPPIHDEPPVKTPEPVKEPVVVVAAPPATPTPPPQPQPPRQPTPQAAAPTPTVVVAPKPAVVPEHPEQVARQPSPVVAVPPQPQVLVPTPHYPMQMSVPVPNVPRETPVQQHLPATVPQLAAAVAQLHTTMAASMPHVIVSSAPSAVATATNPVPSSIQQMMQQGQLKVQLQAQQKQQQQAREIQQQQAQQIQQQQQQAREMQQARELQQQQQQAQQLQQQQAREMQQQQQQAQQLQQQQQQQAQQKMQSVLNAAVTTNPEYMNVLLNAMATNAMSSPVPKPIAASPFTQQQIQALHLQHFHNIQLQALQQYLQNPAIRQQYMMHHPYLADQMQAYLRSTTASPQSQASPAPTSAPSQQQQQRQSAAAAGAQQTVPAQQHVLYENQLLLWNQHRINDAQKNAKAQAKALAEAREAAQAKAQAEAREAQVKAEVQAREEERAKFERSYNPMMSNYRLVSHSPVVAPVAAEEGRQPAAEKSSPPLATTPAVPNAAQGPTLEEHQRLEQHHLDQQQQINVRDHVAEWVFQQAQVGQYLSHLPEPIDDQPDMRKHPLAWTGHLSMKGNETMLNLHFVSGNIECMRGWFGPSPPIPDVPRRDVIRINQRLRLDPSQIGNILRRMQTMDFVCLVGMCAGADREDIVNNTAMLQENFVNYFNNKGIAGIANLNEGPCLPVRVHVFPPCEFSEQYLSQNAPGLYNHLTQKHFQFVFIVATPSE